MHPSVHSSIIYNYPCIEANFYRRPSIGEWIKICVCTYIHTYMQTLEYYPAPQKNENLSFAVTWMDLEVIMLNEMSDNN